MLHRLTFILAVVFCISCTKGGSGGGGSDGDGGGCDALNARIFNGDTCSQASRSAVIAIVPLVSDGEQVGIAGICTGVLVTLDDFITSAHCFTDPARRLGDQLLGFGAVVGGTENGEGIIITNVSIPAEFDGVAGSRFDFAMGTLESVPEPAIGPVPVLFSKPTEQGTAFSAFGYGTNNNGEVGVLKAAKFKVDSLQLGNLIVAADEGGRGASICPGDSGGPAITVHEGVASLIGINSFGTAGGCIDSATNVFGFVDIQDSNVVDFMTQYAPDITVR